MRVSYRTCPHGISDCYHRYFPGLLASTAERQCIFNPGFARQNRCSFWWVRSQRRVFVPAATLSSLSSCCLARLRSCSDAIPSFYLASRPTPTRVRVVGGQGLNAVTTVTGF
jgi:hypothetical protein